MTEQAAFPFPPARGRRSYMMDMDTRDVAVPPTVFRPSPAEPVALVPAEAWEPVPGDPALPTLGTLLLFALLPSDPETAGREMRTPCREEHLVLVDVPPGSGERDVVIGCSLVTVDELRLGSASLSPADLAARCLLPVLLPREGFDREPAAFLALRRPSALFRIHAGAPLSWSPPPMRIAPHCAEGVRAAFLRATRARVR